MKNGVVTKDIFIRRVAQRADFRLTDTYDFFKAFLEVLADLIKEREVLDFIGFASIKYKDIPERRGFIVGYDEDGKKVMKMGMRPPMVRVYFRLKAALTRLAQDAGAESNPEDTTVAEEAEKEA